MHGLRLGVRPEDFIWATGIEDTFVPQTKHGHRALDEYELMGHYIHWREDLALARDLGVSAIRWGVPWYRVEPQPGNFDWRWTDEVLPFMIEELGITPILDLMHYGCPFWLRREFASDEYPDAVARYAAEFSSRYSGLVKWYTPLNEPIVNALMCGKRGLWPPYLRGDKGYIRIMINLALGIQKTVQAIKAIQPGAVMVHVEATGLSRTHRDELQILAIEEQRRGYLCYDLVTGRVTPDHPLFGWLVRSGASTAVLSELVRGRIPLDVVGLNFYPQWSTQLLYVDQKGRLAFRAAEHEGPGFSSLIEDYFLRYRAPVLITETSAFGSNELRSRWLESSVAAVKELRANGIPVLGYTWFPLFTMIDWRYRYGRAPVDEYRIELGLYTLSEALLGPRWDATPLVDQMRGYIADPLSAVGPLVNGATVRLPATVEARERSAFETVAAAATRGLERRETSLPDGRYVIFYSPASDASDSEEPAPGGAEQVGHV